MFPLLSLLAERVLEDCGTSFLAAGQGSYHVGLTSCWPFAGGTTSTQTPVANNKLNILARRLNIDRFIKYLFLTPAARVGKNLLVDVADVGAALLDRLSAQRSKARGRVRYADEGVRTGFVLTVKRCWVVHVEAAGCSSVWIVEPNAHVESLGWGQLDIWIEPKDLIQEDGLDGPVEIAVCVGLKVRLIPGLAKVGEAWIDLAVRQQLAALDGEQVEA